MFRRGLVRLARLEIARGPSLANSAALQAKRTRKCRSKCRSKPKGRCQASHAARAGAPFLRRRDPLNSLVMPAAWTRDWRFNGLCFAAALFVSPNLRSPAALRLPSPSLRSPSGLLLAQLEIARGPSLANSAALEAKRTRKKKFPLLSRRAVFRRGTDGGRPKNLKLLKL